MKKDVNDDLLIRYLLGETSSTEEKEILEWIKADHHNAQKLEKFRFLLESSKALAKNSPADEEEQWEKFKVRRDSNLNYAVNQKMRNSYKLWLRIAAAFLLLSGLTTGGYYFFSRNSGFNNNLVTIKTKNNVLTDTLPDGSTAQLNKNSSITYSNNFNKRRKITLTGEAFFMVKHNASIPFTVFVDSTAISDIGTSFNIKSKSGFLEVIVATGIVKVSRSTATIVLKQHEMIHVARNDKNLIKQTSDDLLYSYYRTNQFDLNNTPLSHIISVFNEIYGSHIRIEGPELNNIPITVTLKKDSLNKMLRVLLLTTPDIKMKENGNDIVLKR